MTEANTDPGSSQRLPIDSLLRPINAFAQHKLGGAVLLMAATLVALIWANSPWAASYGHLLHVIIEIGVGDWSFAKSLHHLINDGLMGVFFFLVGLEIKRELIVGELSTVRKAALPALAAVGGMVIPAGLYILVNGEAPERHGWGVPMATDIAFALGVLAVVSDRVPLGLRVLLTALAIVDDIGAVLVIAVFYTDSIWTTPLLFGFAGLGVSLAMSRGGVRSSLPYYVLGGFVWFAFLKSGVHATIATLLLAFTIPTRTRIDGRRLIVRLEQALERLRIIGPTVGHGMHSSEQEHLLEDVRSIRQAASSPLQTIEHEVAAFVTFFILPVFALANAGVSFEGLGVNALFDGIALGIVIGLVVGKPLGIFVFTWLAVRLGVSELPEGVTWRHVVGIGLLGGIGFTMALFIGGLAFGTPDQLAAAKLGILTASVLAGIGGLLVLKSGPAQG